MKKLQEKLNALNTFIATLQRDKSALDLLVTAKELEAEGMRKAMREGDRRNEPRLDVDLVYLGMKGGVEIFASQEVKDYIEYVQREARR